MTTPSFALDTLPHALLRFLRTPKGLLLVVFGLLTALAAPVAGFALALPGVVAAMAAAAVIDVALARVVRRTWLFPSGALLSGLIVALVLSPTEPLFVPVATATLAVASKYLLRARVRHIFNPAALALVAACLLFASGQSWWGALSDLPTPFVVVLLVTGVFIADRVNKLPMVLAFLSGYLLLFTLAAFVTDPTQVAEIFRAPDITAALFFAFFMLTDPPTSPARYRDQVWFGGMIAVASFAVFLTLGGLYFLPLGLLVGNVWEAWRRVTAQGRARVPKPRAASPVSSTTPQARGASSMIASVPSATPTPQRRLLIMEPTGYWAQTLAPTCERMGYCVGWLHPAALAQTPLVPPDVALIDLTDATAADVAACHLLRQRSDALIVAIIRRGDDATGAAALHAGANECLASPFDDAELHAALQMVVRQDAFNLVGV